MRTVTAVAAGVCQFCGCTDDHACDGGCSWSDDNRTICSQCAMAGQIAEQIVDVFGRITTLPAEKVAGLTLTAVPWSDFTHHQRQLLIMSCRATVEAVREGLAAAMVDDGVAAVIELNAIADFLVEKCPEAIRDEDSTSEAVIRLLSPHIGARIVVP